MSWEKLVRATENLDDPAAVEVYVQPPDAASARIARRIQRNREGRLKFLLMGPKGGGKSSELRAIARSLRGLAVPVGIDFGASGVLARSISAFDILYVGSLALLQRLVHIEPSAEERHYERLAAAYGGPDRVADVPRLEGALEGLVTFAEAAVQLATTAGLTAGAGPLVSAAGGALAKGLRLLSSPRGVVSESSNDGRDMLDVCSAITRELEASVGPVCLLVDGLERMNGESAERFDEVFLATRLIANAPWASVFAAPPCTVTVVHSAGDVGFEEQEVYGLAPEQLALRVRLLERRLSAAQLTPADVDAGVLDHLAARAGSLPRHLVRVLNEACHAVLDDAAPRMTLSHAERGLTALSRSLARALTVEDIDLLKRVRDHRHRPADPAAARLFGDGRILALPAVDGSPLTRWVVHPLLEAVMD